MCLLIMCDQLRRRKGVQNLHVMVKGAENLHVIILTDDLLLWLCEVLRRGGRHHRRVDDFPHGILLVTIHTYSLSRNSLTLGTRKMFSMWSEHSEYLNEFFLTFL